MTIKNINDMLEILGYILLVWGYFVLWFTSVGTYVRMKDVKTLRDLPTFIYYTWYVMLIPGLIVDFLFNITYGVLHYRQFPRDWLFSGTTARILRDTVPGDKSLRRRRALRWKKILNSIDPGHI